MLNDEYNIDESDRDRKYGNIKGKSDTAITNEPITNDAMNDKDTVNESMRNKMTTKRNDKRK